MNIAEIVPSFLPEFNGIGDVCYNNSVQLHKLGNNVVVYTTESAIKNSVPPKIPFPVKRLKPLVRIGNAPILPNLLKINDADVVHLHLPFFFSSDIVYLLHQMKGLPLAVTYHHDPVLKFPFSIVSYYYNFSLNNIMDSASKVFVSSLDYAYNCRLRKKFSQTKTPIEVPIGVDTVRFNPNIESAQTRRKLGLEGASTIILFVGVLDKPHYFKGLEYLLSSFAKLKEKDVRLLVVGEGELKAKYIELSKKLSISSKVLFLGRVTEEELPLLYSISDFLVLPSFTMSEAFGKVLIEAMACGKPVIASDLPGVRSVVSPWVDGLHSKPGDIDDLYQKIGCLVEDPKLRKKLGANGRKKILTDYDWNRVGQKLDGLLREVAKN